jgi:hypothetical protein
MSPSNAYTKGLAWVHQSDGLVAASAGDIDVFQSWPKRSESGSAITDRNEGKVPSRISYSKTNTGEKQWGFSIQSRSTVLEWTKLELMPRSPAQQLATLRQLVNGLWDIQPRTGSETEVPKHLVKNATQIIQDYLYRVAVRWHEYMEENHKGVLSNIDTDFVVTHPTASAPFYVPSS